MTHHAAAKGRQVREAILALDGSLYVPERIEPTKKRWRPSVSVVIPFRNSHEHFEETFQSLEEQTLTDIEILLVNDSSDAPGSCQLLKRLRKHGSISVLDRKRQGGPAAARNDGVRAAKGEFVFLLDADDILAPTALEKMFWLLRFSPAVGFVYSGVVSFGTKPGIRMEEYDTGRLKVENYLTSAALIRKDVYLAVGGMDDTLRTAHEDYDFWLRLAALGIRGKLLPEPLFYYRRHEGGRSSRVASGSTEGEQRKLFKARNPVLFGMGHQHPSHYRPLQQTSRTKWERLVRDLSKRYRSERSLSYESYRRPNTPNPFPTRHWTAPRTRVLYIIPRMAGGKDHQFDMSLVADMKKKGFHVTLVAVDGGTEAMEAAFDEQADEVFVLSRIVTKKTQRLALIEHFLVSRNIDVLLNRSTIIGYESILQFKKDRNELRCADVALMDRPSHRSPPLPATIEAELDKRFALVLPSAPGTTDILQKLEELARSIDREQKLRECVLRLMESPLV
ncbi:MAG: glycosyltransferase family 2 protein [Planctomycetota bacterium]